MAKKKYNTVGMKDMFEEAKERVNQRIKEIDLQLTADQKQLEYMQMNRVEHNGWQGAIEDRNDETALIQEIASLKQERAKTLAELETYQK